MLTYGCTDQIKEGDVLAALAHASVLWLKFKCAT